MSPARKLLAVLATLMVLCVVGLGYWFRSATHVGTPTLSSQVAPANLRATNAAPTQVNAATTAFSYAQAHPADLAPVMAELSDLQNRARAALEAEHWDEAAAIAQRGLKLIESRAGAAHDPSRNLFLDFLA